MPNWISALFSPGRLRLYGWLSLASQIVIVVTGGLVRLTGSGLGCPTWPRCTEESFVTVPEMGIHGIIEFGNRLLTFVLIIIALLTFIVVRRATRSERFGLTWPALALGLGIIAQALLGGVTVLTGLNPWIVGAHFLVSGILISIAAVLVFRIYSPRHKPIAYGSVVLAWPIFFIGWIAVLIGILVTGAGPHSGDANTGRNGLDLEIWQHYHSYPAYLMTALILISLFLAIRSTGLNSPVNKATLSLLLLFAISLVQALIGIIQSRLGVPPLLAAAHMLGASLIIAGLTFQLLTLRSKFQRVR